MKQEKIEDMSVVCRQRRRSLWEFFIAFWQSGMGAL